LAIPDLELLAPLVARFLDGRPLTSCEQVEILHIAQGFETKDSAVADGVAIETIRSRRKRLYGKLGLSSAREVLSSLFALSLKMLADGERIEREPSADEARRRQACNG
jgi:hypothetical protein